MLSQGVKIKGNRKIEAIDISNKNVLLALQIFFQTGYFIVILQ